MIDSLIAQGWDLAPIVLIAVSAIAAAVIVNMFHSPHDVIADVGVCRGPSNRKTVFAVSRHNLVRSVDEQPWEWLTSGLGAHKISALALSPAYASDETLFAATFGGGIFRSRNGGLGWRECNVGLAQRFIVKLAIDPDFVTTGVIVALGLDGSVYRSRDRGESWTELPHPWRSSPDGEDEAHRVLLDPMRDAGEAWNACYQPTGASCIACGPGGIIVVGTSEGEVFRFSAVADGWTSIATVPNGHRATAVAVTQNEVFVGTDGAGIFDASLAGDDLEPLAVPRALKRVTALLRCDSRLLATSWDDALFVSNDDGTTWAHRGDGLTRHRQADERRFGAPHFNVIAVDGADLYVGGFDGLFRAAHSENAWQPLETLVPNIVIDLAVSAAADKNCSVAVSTYGAGVSIESQQLPRDGMPATRRLGPIRFAPAESNAPPRVLVGSEARVLAWNPADSSWHSATLTPVSGRQRSARLFLYARSAERFASRHLSAGTMNFLKRGFQSAALATSGRVSRVVFPTAIEFSPRYLEDHIVYVGTREHGLFRSNNAGQSFRQVWDAGSRYIFALDTLQGTSLLLALLPDGVHRSQNNGDTWAPPAPGAPAHQTALVVSPAFHSDATLFTSGPGGLHRSRDGGTTWTVLNPSFISGVALSPEFGSDGTMLAHVRGVGLFRSTDAGDTFEHLPGRAGNADPAFCVPMCFPDSTTLIRFSPRFAVDKTVIAASMADVYVSNDAGRSWQKKSGPEKRSPTAVQAAGQIRQRQRS